jgi:hypothetical protein
MEKGFDVVLCENGDLSKEECTGASSGFHHALDKLLAELDSHEGTGLAGGCVQFKLSDGEGNEFNFRLQLQQIDGEQECVFCNGTGIEGS